MKNWTLASIIVTISLLAGSSQAVDSAFVFGDNAAIIDAGVEVAPDVTVGLRGMFSYGKDGISDTHLKIDRKWAGAFIHYPVLSVTSDKLPVEGVVYAGASVLYGFAGDGDVYFLPEAGVDTVISSRVMARVVYLYNKRSEMFDDSSQVLFGIKVAF